MKSQLITTAKLRIPIFSLSYRQIVKYIRELERHQGPVLYMEVYTVDGVQWGVGKSGGIKRKSTTDKWYTVKDTDRSLLSVVNAIIKERWARAHRIGVSGTSQAPPHRIQNYAMGVQALKKQNADIRVHMASLPEDAFMSFLERFQDIVLMPAAVRHVRAHKASDFSQSDAMKQARRVFGGSKFFVACDIVNLCLCSAEELSDDQLDTKDEDAYYEARERAVGDLATRINDCPMPTLDMVKRRLGAHTAGQYRMALEALETHPDPVFQVEPQYAECDNMNDVTMKAAVRAAVQLSCGDIELLVADRNEAKSRSNAHRRQRYHQRLAVLRGAT